MKSEGLWRARDTAARKGGPSYFGRVRGTDCDVTVKCRQIDRDGSEMEEYNMVVGEALVIHHVSLYVQFSLGLLLADSFSLAPSSSSSSLLINEHLAVLLPRQLWKACFPCSLPVLLLTGSHQPDSSSSTCDNFYCRVPFSLFERKHVRRSPFTKKESFSSHP